MSVANCKNGDGEIVVDPVMGGWGHVDNYRSHFCKVDCPHCERPLFADPDEPIELVRVEGQWRIKEPRCHRKMSDEEFYCTLPIGHDNTCVFEPELVGE